MVKKPKANKDSSKPPKSTKTNKEQDRNDDSEFLDLKEMLELGGTQEDFDMLMKNNDEEIAVDENNLLLDLQKFMKNDLKLDPSKSTIVIDEDSNDSDALYPQKPPSKDAKELKKESKNKDASLNKIKEVKKESRMKDTHSKMNDSHKFEKRLAQLSKTELVKAQCVLSEEKWFDLVHEEPFTGNRDWEASHVEGFYQQYFELATDFYEKEVILYEKFKEKSQSSSSKEFVSTVLKSGTVSDKISALALLIQESPLHTFKFMSVNLFQNMAAANSTGSKRNVSYAVEALKDLLLNTLLPNDRKLRYFRDQPFLHESVTPKQLCLWYYEDALKKFYFEFLRLLEELLRDTLFHIKSKALVAVWELLSAKPEQEQNLLAILINKMGDQEKKIAAKSVYLLHLLLQHHPNMKLIVVKEVQQFLIRQNISQRSQYYAITFLNQIVFRNSGDDVPVANALIDVYFGLFEELIRVEPQHEKSNTKSDSKSKGKGKASETQNTWDGLNAKMLAALLTGVNRALPYSKLEEDILSKHVDTLFKITHVGTFNTSIQALALLHQISSFNLALGNRYYRALYDTLLDRRLYSSNKQSFYLNLLFKSMVQDPSLKRCSAFLKRLLQVCVLVGVPFVCATLYLFGQIASQRPGVWGLVNTAEDEDDEVEKFVDADKEQIEIPESQETEQAEDEAPSSKNIKEDKYDGLKREPLYANADRSCFWELIPLLHHFHPTVTHYASFLVAQQPIPDPDTVNYDPLQNHTLIRFLDRFVNKNPKKVSSLCNKGNSIMQPKLSKSDDMLVAGGVKKPNMIVKGENSKPIVTDDVPLAECNWNRQESEIPVDERFFYYYFKDNAKQPRSKEHENVDVDNDEVEEELVWDAIKKSSGFPTELQQVDEEDEEDFEEDDEEDKEDTINEDVSDEFDEELDDDMAAWADEGTPEEVSADEDTLMNTSDFSDDAFDAMDEKQVDKKPVKREKLIDRLANRAKSLGFKGNYFDKLQRKAHQADEVDWAEGGDDVDNVFASIDDFNTLLEYDNNEGLDENPKIGTKKRKRHGKMIASKKKMKS